MYELIFSKKAFSAIKEKLDKSRYFAESPKSKDLNMKPGEASVPVSQKTEDASKPNPGGPVEKLEYPTKKESSMNKESAQQLPGSEKINAGEAVTKGEKGKLTFPTGPAKDPSASMSGMSKDKSAQQQISDGPKGDIKHGGGEGKAIKLQWNVATDAKIGQTFIDGGDKGDIKKAPAHAKEPGVSQTKVPGADNFMDGGESTKPIQKQFSINFQRESAQEKAQIIESAITCALDDLLLVANKLGTPIAETTLAEAYSALANARTDVKKTGSLAPRPVAKTETPLKATAAAKNVEAEADAAAEKTGKLIF